MSILSSISIVDSIWHYLVNPPHYLHLQLSWSLPSWVERGKVLFATDSRTHGLLQPSKVSCCHRVIRYNCYFADTDFGQPFAIGRISINSVRILDL
jgi:hypothetical protein